MIPLVAIVGRPNVGKSTLFNRLVGKQVAIVANVPGVTRDRHYADARWGQHPLSIVDTGGFDPTDEDPLRQGIARGVQLAIAEADVVICVLDALNPPTEADRQAVVMLRKSGAKVVYWANRADNPQQEMLATDLYQLGIEPLLIGSALHNRHVNELQASVVALLPEGADEILLDETEESDAADESAPESDADEAEVPNAKNSLIHIALLGRPNAGKSSLLNRLSKSERSLVDDRPGTTRDPVDAMIEYGGHRYRIVDTAGIRRKSKIHDDIEAASVMRALRTMGEAQVIVLMCDASEGLSEQDAKLLALGVDRGRAVIVGMNKMDLLPKNQQKAILEEAKTTLHFAPWAPVLSLSVKNGSGVGVLMRAVNQAFDEYHKRVPTSQLNRFAAEVLERNPPPSKHGRVPKIYYLTQARTAPPLFVAMCSSPDALPEAYRRFVQNQLRNAFAFKSVPVRVRFRARRRRETPE